LNFYKATVQYKGTDYFGWQVQPGEVKTIQGEINKALKKTSKSENIRTIGSGRTDAGVHAFGQVFRIEMPLQIPNIALLKALNSQLPNAIRVTHVEDSNENFHPVFQAQKKEYKYLFSLDKETSPFSGELITNYRQDLDIDYMQKACKAFLGEHNFQNYQCSGTEVATTIRMIDEIEIIKHESTAHWKSMCSEYYELRIVGNGFLKQMVRLIMGTLVQAGKGKVSVKDIEASFQEKLKDRLGPVAPPQGLYLNSVTY
jgi:tRNA pseudouridine38-40 synthase